MTSLKQAHWLNRFWRGQSSNTSLKQAHLVKQVDNTIAMIFIWIWFGFWFWHAHRRGWLWRHHWSRLTDWTGSEEVDLQTCHWSRLTVLNTLIEEVDFDDTIEAGSLTEQVLKRSIFKHIIEAGSLSWTGRQHHCDSLHLNLIQILVLSLFWGSRGSGSGSVSTELHVLVLGQTLNHWVVCSEWALNCWVIYSDVVHSVSHVLMHLIHSVSHDSSRLICSSSGFLVAAI